MTIALSGREIFPSDGNPIIGADVYAYRADTNALVDQTTTDANGDWSMSVDSLAAGYNTKVIYGQGIRWGYINQKIQAQSVIIDGSITVRDWANSSDVTKIDGGDIYVGSLIEIASSGSIRSGQTAYNTGTGWWLGDVAGTPKFSIGNPAGNSLTWDGTTLAITGTITATAGTIGGWTINATTITADLMTINSLGIINAGSGNDIVGIDGRTGATNRLYIGNASDTLAPFRVTGAGALTATSATITGAITATSGSIGSFTIGTYLYTGSKTAWNDANAGVHVGSDGIGIGNNVFTVNGSTGALVATSATITGTITATAGAIGGWTVGATTLSCDFSATQTAAFLYLGNVPGNSTRTGSIYCVQGATYPSLRLAAFIRDGAGVFAGGTQLYIGGGASASSGSAFEVYTNYQAGAQVQVLNLTYAGALEVPSGSIYCGNYIYPGNSSTIQITRYISDDGTQTYISAGLKVAGLAGTGTRTVVVDANGVMSAP